MATLVLTGPVSSIASVTHNGTALTSKAEHRVKDVKGKAVVTNINDEAMRSL